jgi:hypothetical protein
VPVDVLVLLELECDAVLESEPRPELLEDVLVLVPDAAGAE